MELHNSKPYIPIYEKIAFFKSYNCSSCRRTYSTQVHANNIIGRIPLLMPCSHTVCEECLSIMAKTKNISCKVCKYEMILENKKELDYYFPVDRFLFGSLMNLNLTKGKTVSGSEKVLPFLPAGSLTKEVRRYKQQSTGGPSQPEFVVKNCSQDDCVNRAEYNCINCSEVYCFKCDKRVHESIRILRNHVRFPVDVTDLTNFSSKCATHSNSPGEYSCITCDSMLCSKCVIKEHNGHEVISVEDKNTQDLKPFTETLRKGKVVLKTMESTQKKLKQEIKLFRQDVKTSDLEFDVIKYFATLHSRLQLLEQNILEQYSKAQATKIDTLHQLSNDLESKINSMQCLISTANMILTKGGEHLDKLVLSELGDNITANLTQPCEIENWPNDSDNIRFIFDESFLDGLQNHCKIEFEDNICFKLKPITDLNEKQFESISDESIISDAESAKSECSGISYVTPGCKSRISLAGKVPTMFKIEKPGQTKNENDPAVFLKDTVENIVVTHLTDPTNFYVQLCRKRKQIEQLSNKYELYAEQAVIPTNPEIGSMYIVQYESENVSKWCRATLKDIHTTGVATLYEVFYIDYGNTALVPLSKLRKMKAIFLNDAPFAYNCRLNGIKPQKDNWKDDVLSYMLQFITSVIDPPRVPALLSDLLNTERNSTLKMQVYGNHKGVLDVNLYSYNESLVTALIFMGYAKFNDNYVETIKKQKISSSESDIPLSIINYQKEKSYKISVVHVLDPFNIYVQSTSNTKVIENLVTAMTRFYDRKESRKLIFNPEIGMTCAAKISSNKTWWRVKIIDIIGDANVRVFVLDYGYTEIVPWRQLCKLRDIHRHIDAQAVLVSLADIAPPKNCNNEWPEETNHFLREYLKDKELTMYVTQPSKQKLTVTIYEHTNEADICVDALLVRKELAKSTGELSLQVEFHNIIPKNNEKRVKKNSMGQVVPDSKSQERIQDQKISMMSGKHFIVEVKVLNIISPSSFYVEIPEWCDEKNRMLIQLMQFYSEQTSPCKKWELNEKCVVQSLKDEKYYRGIITNVLEDHTYEVFLKDIVRTETVLTRHMYTLDAIFATHDYTLHCQLGGLKPAGDVNRWASKATEVFQDFVEQYNRLYISKYGPIIDKTLAVQLMASWEENVGPLEPAKIETLILNDVLINSGLALPIKTISPEPSTETVSSAGSVVSNHSVSSNLQNNENTSNSSTLLEGDYCLTTNSLPSSQIKLSTWLPAMKLIEKKMKIWPTNVDFDGSIYFQTAKAKRLLKNMNRILDTHFKTSLPDPQHNWEPEQMCTVLYHVDNSFCRGTVLDVTGEKIIVRLIDYGNQEEVTHEELRSEVLAADIPTLAIKCKLSHVVPKTKNGLWPVHILDQLHLTIVDKECDIVLNEDIEMCNDVPSVLLFIDNECINTLCNNADWSREPPKSIKKHSESDDDRSVIIEDEITNENSSTESVSEPQIESTLIRELDNYSYVKLPQNIKSFKAVVINMIDYQTIILETEFIGQVMNETRDQFNSMSQDIAMNGSKQSEITLPIVGMPCIALYGDDQTWYRAKILHVMDSKASQIQVLFVDYGNIDTLPKEHVKVIKQEWLHLPVSLIKCKIWGICKHPDFDTDSVNTVMKEAILDKQVICQIQKIKPEIEVKLIDEETYNVVYQYIIDGNVIQCTN